MYQLKNVGMKFKKKTLFEDFSYEIEDTGLYYIKGPSGCGKTTLIRLLLLDSFTYSGDIYYNGINIRDLSLKEKEKIHQDITYLGIKNTAFSELNLYENLKVILGSEYDETKISEIFESFSLLEHRKKKYKHLSAGEKQRFLLTIPFLRNQKIVIIDEGFSNLDRNNSKKMSLALEELSKTCAVVLVEHIISNINQGAKIIDFEKLESEAFVLREEKQAIEESYKKRKIKGLIKIYKKHFLILLILGMISSVFTSIFSFSLITTSLTKEERMSLTYKAMPTQMVLLDENRVDGKNYGMEDNTILYSLYSYLLGRDDYNFNPMGLCVANYILSEGKKIKVEDGVVYTSSRDAVVPVFSKREICKNRFIEFSNENVKEGNTKDYYFESEFFSRLPATHEYGWQKFVNYKTFREVNPAYFMAVAEVNGEPRLLMSYDYLSFSLYRGEVHWRERVYDYSSSYIVNFPNYKIETGFMPSLLSESHNHESVGKLHNLEIEIEGTKISTSMIKDGYVSHGYEATVNTKKYGELMGFDENRLYAAIYVNGDFFSKEIQEKKITLGDRLEKEYKKAYYFTEDSDVVSLIRDNQEYINRGEEEIFRLVNQKNFEYQYGLLETHIRQVSFFEGIGISGFLLMILIILTSLLDKNTKILLNYGCSRKRIFGFLVVLESISCFVIVLSCSIGSKLMFEGYFHELHLKFSFMKEALMITAIFSTFYWMSIGISTYCIINKRFRRV